MKRLLGPDGKPLRSRVEALQEKLRDANRRVMKARYDAAQTSAGNAEHWKWADTLSPDQANTHAVRERLRSRSRYEAVQNNSFLKGIVLQICNDFVKSGPKMRIIDERIRPERRAWIEMQNNRWAKATHRRHRLWRYRHAKCVDGETFGFAFTDDRINHDVKLNYMVIEADQVSNPFTQVETLGEVDGIRVDGLGRPTEYWLLREHPGGVRIQAGEGQWVPASAVVHWFRQERGWLRGVPETTASLPLCAILRRYTLATVQAAEVAADFAAVLQTDGPAHLDAWQGSDGTVNEEEAFQEYPITRGMFTNLPWGYKLGQLKAEQPVTTYDAFTMAIMLEIARPLMVPQNIALGTSANSNMSSAVADAHIYRSNIEAERLDCEEKVLMHETNAWWQEAVLTPGYLTEPIMTEEGEVIQNDLEGLLMDSESFRTQPPAHKWLWPMAGLMHTDPLKVAMAAAQWSNSYLMTDRDVQSEFFGRDVEEWEREKDDDALRRRRWTELSGLVPTGSKGLADTVDDDTDLEDSGF